jgi:predicted ABC-type ATPase
MTTVSAFPPWPAAGEDDGPVLVVIAGPNGSGKTTFYEEYIAPHGLPFVNADLIAKDMEAGGERISDYEAAKLAEARRRDYLGKKQSFCFETVFSDRVGSKRRFLKDAQKSGYAVLLLFIGLSHVDVSRARVLQRVLAGGHAVPDRKIEERFPRTFDNLRQAIGFVDRVFLFDNSSFDHPYRPIAVCASGKVIQLFPPLPPWAQGVLPRPLIPIKK